MASQSNGHSVLLDRALKTEDAQPSLPPAVRVDESGDALLVRVSLEDGLLELRIPLATVRRRPLRHHIPGCNPDATPC